MSCGVGCRHSSDLVLLWLWHRLAATALIRPLAWKLPYATGVALKRQKNKPTKTPQKTTLLKWKLSGDMKLWKGSCLTLNQPVCLNAHEVGGLVSSSDLLKWLPTYIDCVLLAWRLEFCDSWVPHMWWKRADTFHKCPKLPLENCTTGHRHMLEKGWCWCLPLTAKSQKFKAKLFYIFLHFQRYWPALGLGPECKTSVFDWSPYITSDLVKVGTWVEDRALQGYILSSFAATTLMFFSKVYSLLLFQ